MQQLLLWTYPTWLMSWGHKGWYSDQTIAKLKIKSEIHLQPYKSPLMSHKCSPQGHLFSPEHFQDTSPASLEPAVLSPFGESLSVKDITLPLLIPIQKLVKRAERINLGTGSWKIWLPGLKFFGVWTSKEMTIGRRAGQALYLSPEQQQHLPCTLLQFTSLTTSLDFSMTSFQICLHIRSVTHWATLNEQFSTLYLQKSLKKTLIQI